MPNKKYIEKAKEYCKTHNLSVDKLLSQRKKLLEPIYVFAQPSDVIPNGLCNDLATQPKATLIYHIDTDTFEETKHTKMYLGN